jgi:LPXTG-site transpeptidase (sortase) family protein
MDAPAVSLFALPRRFAVVAVTMLVAVVLAAANPAVTQARTYTSISGLSGATRADRIIIKRIGVKMPIRKGVIGGTVRERIAYHYPGTSWPGGHSNTYLYAHARVGSFIDLKKLQVGDIVKLRLKVSRVWVRYVVKKVKRVPWNDGRWTLLTANERLTLQTCTGNTATADRIVVVAVPLS